MDYDVHSSRQPPCIGLNGDRYGHHCCATMIFFRLSPACLLFLDNDYCLNRRRSCGNDRPKELAEFPAMACLARCEVVAGLKRRANLALIYG